MYAINLPQEITDIHINIEKVPANLALNGGVIPVFHK
jgi:hypothetical protein